MRELNIPLMDYRFQCPTPSTFKHDATDGHELEDQERLRSLCTRVRWSCSPLDCHIFVYKRLIKRHGQHPPELPLGYSGSSTECDIDILTRSPLMRPGIEGGLTTDEILDQWQHGLESLRQKKGISVGLDKIHDEAIFSSGEQAKHMPPIPAQSAQRTNIYGVPSPEKTP